MFEYDDPEKYARAIFFFDTCRENEGEPYIRRLRRTLGKPGLFRDYAFRIVEKTKTQDMDSRFKQGLFVIWTNYIRDIGKKPEDHDQELSLDIFHHKHMEVMYYNFMRALSLMRKAHFDALVRFIDSSFSKETAVDRYIGRSLVFQPYKAVVRVALVAGVLSFEIYQNIRRWWKGEIQGIRCVKNIVDCGVRRDLQAVSVAKFQGL